MSLEITDFIEGVRSSRLHFWKHTKGMSPEQLIWKPYPECKSVLETLQHLVIDDETALGSFQSGEEPDYDSVKVDETELGALTERLETSHQALLSYIEGRFGDGPLDAEACAWGSKMPVARAVALLSSEDYYHAGQVAFIRQATDPAWDYYASVYGD